MGHPGDHHDDDGLPRVDVVVPDDARELERDVQAYRRELRQQRRQARWLRLSRPLRRRGLVMPLAVIFVLLVTLSTTLIIVLSPRATDRPAPAALAEAPTASPGDVGGLLPDVELAVDGDPRAARTLRPAVIALVPRDCGCGQAADELYRQARALSLRVYFVASGRPASELRDLGGSGRGLAVLVQDRTGALASAYDASGLTAVLVRRDGVVTDVVRDPEPGMRLEPKLAPLGRSP